MKRILSYLTLLIVFCTGLGCNDSSTTPSGDIVFPDSNISYAAYVQPLFNLRCSNTGCHDDQSRAGDLSLSSYFALTSKPGMIIPGNSKSSLLAQKIDGRLPHQNTIPIIINTNQSTGVKKWIDEGAKNN